MLLRNCQLFVLILDFCLPIVLITKNQNYKNNELFETNLMINEM